MGVRDGLLVSRDFSSTPGTSFTVDIPAGYTIANVVVHNCSLSASEFIKMELSSGGTSLGLTMRQFTANTTTSQVNEVSEAVISFIGTSNLYGAAQIWNFNTLAPVTMFGQHFMSTWEIRSGVWKSTASINQMIFSTSGGSTINGGTIYVQLYTRSNTIVSQDFGAGSLSNWDITGLDSEATAIVLSSFDLTTSASVAITARVSVNGTTFDDGASDYLLGFVHATSDNALVDDKMTAAQFAGTSHGFCSLFLGLPVLASTLYHSNDMTLLGSGALLSMGNREARQVETGLRLFPDSGTINGGTGYAVKYAL